MKVLHRHLCTGVFLLAGLFVLGLTNAQARQAGSRNMTLVSHVALTEAPGGPSGLVLEQDPARPFAYVAGGAGFIALDLTDPGTPRIHAPRSVAGTGVTGDITYFKLGDRYFLVEAFRPADGMVSDIGAVVFDVTDPSGSFPETARIRRDGGLSHLFAYRHSDGRVLLFATDATEIHVYDMARVVTGADDGHLASIPVPEHRFTGEAGFDDVFAGYHPDTGQDLLYTAGSGGYYVFNVSDPSAPKLIGQVNQANIRKGYASAPSPDGRYLVAGARYDGSPLRIFDLKPIFDGDHGRVRTAVGAWTANWKRHAERFEVRWPFVFVANGPDGLQVFNMRDPYNPYTTGFYHTASEGAVRGANHVDVRNTDGLIMVSDAETGLWTFRMEAFQGWSGAGWGMPEVSSAQHWTSRETTH